MEDAGVLVASGAFVDEADVDAVVSPARTAGVAAARSGSGVARGEPEAEPGDYRLLAPRASRWTAFCSPTA